MNDNLKLLNQLFNKIYVISHNNSSRFSYIKNQLKGVDFDFFLGPEKENIDIEKLVKEGYPKWMAYQFAVTFTHLNLMEQIKKQNEKNILILEDDIFIRKYNLSYLKNEFDNIKDNYDLFYLGLFNKHINYDKIMKPNFTNHLFKINGKHPYLEGSSSYVIGSHRFIDFCLDHQYSDKSKFKVIDGLFWFNYHKFNSYLILPQIMIQNPKFY